MKLNRSGSWIVRSVLISVFALTGVLFLAWRSSPTHAQAPHVPVHMTTDWSNRHVVFSAPTTSEQKNKIQADQRYIQQQLSRQNAAPVQVKP